MTPFSSLKCAKRNPDGSVTAQCPACYVNGRDRSGNHLRVWSSGAFHCIIDDSREHNKIIRANLRGNVEDFEYIEPPPVLKVERIYPEDSLKKLVRDHSYWKARGIKPEVMDLLEAGVAPDDEKNKLSGRAILPIRGMDGRIRGFTGRLIRDNNWSPKWKHVFPCSKVCWPWGVNGDAIRQSGKAVLVESVGDLASLMSADIRNTLCVFGLRVFSPVVGALVAANVKKVIISLNNDKDPNKGHGAALRIRQKLSSFFPEENIVVRLPNGFKDWNDALMGGDTGLEELRQFKGEIETL